MGWKSIYTDVWYIKWMRSSWGAHNLFAITKWWEYCVCVCMRRRRVVWQGSVIRAKWDETKNPQRDDGIMKHSGGWWKVEKRINLYKHATFVFRCADERTVYNGKKGLRNFPSRFPFFSNHSTPPPNSVKMHLWKHNRRGPWRYQLIETSCSPGIWMKVQ